MPPVLGRARAAACVTFRESSRLNPAAQPPSECGGWETGHVAGRKGDRPEVAWGYILGGRCISGLPRTPRWLLCVTLDGAHAGWGASRRGQRGGRTVQPRGWGWDV